MWLRYLLGLPRGQKRALQVFADVLLLAFSYFAAMFLRFGHFGFLAEPGVWLAFGGALPVSLAVFIKLGFYRAVIRYVTLRAVRTVVTGLALSALVMALISAWAELPVPATVPVIYALIALATVGGVRFGFRGLFQRTHSRDKLRVIIYGAGQSGRQTAQSLISGQDYNPVAFVDDNPDLWGAQVMGIRVFASEELGSLVEDYHVKTLLLAIPSATPGVRARILRRLEELPLHVQTIPDMAQILRGRYRSGEVTEVPVEDLLGRDIVPPDPALMGADIRGKVVMVTGGAGSIGAELCRQIIGQAPAELIVLDHSEYALYACGNELRQICARNGYQVRITQMLCSVMEGRALEGVLRNRGVSTIYHAAAYKHVPLLEDNALRGLANNVFGTLRCIRAAAAAGVESFILISTDKAVRPANVMGASKRIAELICQAEAQSSSAMRVSMVRFGNVLASSGSVVPLFRQQILSGGPVTVTDPEITRYFMTIPEAAQLVIQAGAMARGGEVFLLDMGEPVKIVELASRMIRLSGYQPLICSGAEDLETLSPGNIAIIFTKLRKGEKLYEELLVDACSERTRHPRIRSASEAALKPEAMESLLRDLRRCCDNDDEAGLRHLLEAAPAIGYAPQRRGPRRVASLAPSVSVGIKVMATRAEIRTAARG